MPGESGRGTCVGSRAACSASIEEARPRKPSDSCTTLPHPRGGDAHVELREVKAEDLHLAAEHEVPWLFAGGS